MKATLEDAVFGTLTWDEDAEMYSGEAEFRPGQRVAVQVVVNNADETSPRELKAFLSAARAQFQRLQADDAAFRDKAAGLFRKALQKAARPATDGAALNDALALAAIEIHNTGMTRLLYGAGSVWPKKRVSFFVDGSDRVV